MTKGTEQFEKMAQEASENMQEQAQAYIESCNIFAKGLEDLVKQHAAFAQSFAEKQMKFMNDAMTVKTLDELTAAQKTAVQDNVEALTAHVTKNTEAYIKLSQQAVAPLNAALDKTVKKANQTVNKAKAA